jgi:hypothetical protein
LLLATCYLLLATYYCSRSDEFADSLDDGLFIRELVALLLRVDERIVHRDLEDPAAGGQEGQCADLILVIVEQCVRQTDGPIEVSSGGAVFDGNLHVLCHPLCLLTTTNRYTDTDA